MMDGRFVVYAKKDLAKRGLVDHIRAYASFSGFPELMPGDTVEMPVTPYYFKGMGEKKPTLQLL